jgi:hypothetical protein
VRYAMLFCTVLLGGCNLVAAGAGVAAGGGAAAATGNPVIGYAVGLGVRAGADEVVRYYVRVRKTSEQDAIAEVAGDLPLGETRHWEIRHTIPIGNTRGTLSVVTEIPNPLAPCREVMFLPEDEESPFLTQVCRDSDRWHWASAEPAVDRWGNLQ